MTTPPSRLPAQERIESPPDVRGWSVTFQSRQRHDGPTPVSSFQKRRGGRRGPATVARRRCRRLAELLKVRRLESDTLGSERQGDSAALGARATGSRPPWGPVSYTHLRAHETPEHLV